MPAADPKTATEIELQRITQRLTSIETKLGKLLSSEELEKRRALGKMMPSYGPRSMSGGHGGES
jgi:hypothetical protein